MQDNLAYKTDEPYIKMYEPQLYEPQLKLRENVHTQRIATIRSTIDALFDMRLSLSVKKVISPFIKRSELDRIVNLTKEKIVDLKVKEEIDKVFDEYLNIKSESILPSAKDIWNNNSLINKMDVESKINDNINSLMSQENTSEQSLDYQGEEKGTSLTLRDKHFNSDKSNTDIKKAE